MYGMCQSKFRRLSARFCKVLNGLEWIEFCWTAEKPKYFHILPLSKMYIKSCKHTREGLKADLHWTIFWSIVMKIRGEKVVLISTWIDFVARIQEGTPAFQIEIERGWRNPAI